ncbi:MAG: helix-turn-helix domain-containing protein [Patescibacteria group bacterium]
MRGYSRIYWETIPSFGITHTEAAFLALVDSLSRNEGVCFASKERLAEIMGLSKVTIFKMIKKLQKMDLLEKHGYSKYKTSKLVLTERYKECIEEEKEKIKNMKNEH